MALTGSQTRTINLPDGRRLAYNEYGSADGHPVLYFHGAPSARIEPELFDLPNTAEQLGIRLISPDRPGLGRSDFQPRRTISDWPADVITLADHLGLNRFSILGYSGGGPYALACALQIPERLTSIGLVSSTGPHDVPGLTDAINQNSLKFMQLCENRPWMARIATRLMAVTARRMPGRLVSGAVSSLPEPDAQLMREPERGERFARLVSEAARSGGRGPQHDTALMVRHWGIDLSAIEFPVRLWHGEEDLNAPIAMGRYLAGKMLNATPTYLPGAGHLSLMFRHGTEILRELVKNR